MNLLTLKELNNLSCSKNVLNLLRTLNTSDLGFFYMCLNRAALEDIVQTCTDLLEAEGDETDLTEDELEEAMEYLLTMEKYIREL